LDVQKQTV